MLNLFQHLCNNEKILTFVRMTMTVMLNLFQHLCQMEKIPICIGMTRLCHAEFFSASRSIGRDSVPMAIGIRQNDIYCHTLSGVHTPACDISRLRRFLGEGCVRLGRLKKTDIT